MDCFHSAYRRDAKTCLGYSIRPRPNEGRTTTKKDDTKRLQEHMAINFKYPPRFGQGQAHYQSFKNDK